MRDLDDIRQNIDEIDREMLALFEKRMAFSREVAQYKEAHNMPIFVPEREKAVLEHRIRLLQDRSLEKMADSFFRMLMDLSKEEQMEALAAFKKSLPDTLSMRDAYIAYQGVPGANSEQAAYMYFGDEAPKIAYKQFRDVFDAVLSGKAQYGVLPIENSTAGSVYDVYDLLGETDCSIVGEQTIAIDHCLLAKRGAKLENLQYVYSHPQALRQCAKFIQQQGLEEKAYSNTAAAAQFVSEQNIDNIAAIASRRAAVHYGLDIVAADIQDRQDNVTRFVIVAKEPKAFTGEGKVSLRFTLRHRSGSLYLVLHRFAEKNLNLTKIESRVIPTRPFEYCFYMDFEGDISMPALHAILKDISELTLDADVLGAYYPDESRR